MNQSLEVDNNIDYIRNSAKHERGKGTKGANGQPKRYANFMKSSSKSIRNQKIQIKRNEPIHLRLI
jgi:hypothetical protein